MVADKMLSFFFLLFSEKTKQKNLGFCVNCLPLKIKKKNQNVVCCSWDKCFKGQKNMMYNTTDTILNILYITASSMKRYANKWNKPFIDMMIS